MSTAQRRGPKQSKLAAWQSLQPKEEVEVQVSIPAPEVEEVPIETPTQDVEVEESIPEPTVEETIELPKIVKKNKKTD